MTKYRIALAAAANMLASVSFTTFGQSQSIDSDALMQFANGICQRPPIDQSNGKTELNAEGEARLNGFLRYLANMGIDAQAKHTSQSSHGVPQDQLAAALASGNNCAMNVAIAFKDAFTLTPHDPVGKNRGGNDKPPPVPSNSNANKITYGPFSVGDSFDDIRKSGVNGKLNYNKDGSQEFAIETRIPITRHGQYGDFTTNLQGTVGYQIRNGIVSAIDITVPQFQPCSTLDWPNEILSDTTMEFGQPTRDSPQSKHMTENGPNGAVVEDLTVYEFHKGGEERDIALIEASPVQNMASKRCIVVIERHRDP